MVAEKFPTTEPLELAPDEGAMVDLDEEAQPVVDEGFKIDSADAANWVVRKIANARERAEKAREWAAREVKQAERDEQFFLARFGVDLRAWAAQQIAENGGRKRSVALPGGTLGFRKHAGGLQIDNAEAVMAWARTSCPAAVVVVPATEKLSKSALNDAVRKTGVVPDGAHVEEDEDRFYVK